MQAAKNQDNPSVYTAQVNKSRTTLTTIYVASANGLPQYEGSYDFGVSDGHLWMITSGVGGDWFNNGKGKKATYLILGVDGQ